MKRKLIILLSIVFVLYSAPAVFSQEGEGEGGGAEGAPEEVTTTTTPTKSKPKKPKFNPDSIILYARENADTGDEELVRAMVDSGTGVVKKDVVASEDRIFQSKVDVHNGNVYIVYSGYDLSTGKRFLKLIALPDNDLARSTVLTAPLEVGASFDIEIGQRNGWDILYIVASKSQDIYLLEYYNSWKIENISPDTIGPVGFDIKLFSDSSGDTTKAKILTTRKQSVLLLNVDNLNQGNWTTTFDNPQRAGFAVGLSENGSGVAYMQQAIINGPYTLYYKYGTSDIPLFQGKRGDLSSFDNRSTVIFNSGRDVYGVFFYGPSLVQLFNVGVVRGGSGINLIDIAVNKEMVGASTNNPQTGDYFVAVMSAAGGFSGPMASTVIDFYPIVNAQAPSSPIVIDQRTSLNTSLFGEYQHFHALDVASMK